MDHALSRNDPKAVLSSVAIRLKRGCCRTMICRLYSGEMELQTASNFRTLHSKIYDRGAANPIEGVPATDMQVASQWRH
jgi:hypothetical protein